MKHTPSALCPDKGFSLVEMAMVLAIVTLLLGGLLPTLSAQMEAQRLKETRKQLDEIQQALLGYAIINGRLPCPAYSSGEEDPVGGGICNHAYDGFVPAATLGLTTTDSNGFAVDPWGNRIRYAVASSNAGAFTKPNGMSATGLSALAPNLLVCSTATGISGSSCAAGAALTSSPGVPAVIYSSGKNGAAGSPAPDEQANTDGNRTFVSHTPTPDFDDQVAWLSGNILINRMVTAGKLP
jgi:prepilin-type N-terminal cleavage/methylation domain-containing protein